MPLQFYLTPGPGTPVSGSAPVPGNVIGTATYDPPPPPQPSNPFSRVLVGVAATYFGIPYVAPFINAALSEKDRQAQEDVRRIDAEYWRARSTLAQQSSSRGPTMFDEFGNDISAPGGYGGYESGFPAYSNGEFGGGDSGGFGDWSRIAQTGARIFSDTGGGGLPPGLTPAAFPMVAALGGMAAAGARTLASLFSRAGAAASFNINGIRGTIPQLWKYTRRFGPGAVAQGLGITVGALGAMLMSAPDAGRRYRRRGISARDIRTTKRVVGFVSKMAQTIGCVRAPRHFTRTRRK